MAQARHILPAAVAVLAIAAPAAHAQAPSLAADQAFAPPTGIARLDFATGTVADIPAAVAVHGDRIYTVGRTQGGTGGQDIGITAQRRDGALDTGFSDDGKLIVPIAPGTEADIGTGIAVLPDGRLRVIGATDRTAGSGESLDVALLGFNADGSPDTTFGDPATGDGRTGRIVFPAGPNSDVPSRIAVAPDGRLAITGSRNDGVRDDLFVSFREADGTPVTSFGTNGVQFVNRGGVVAGTTLVDRGIDVAFRPGGALVVLALVETNPGAGNDFAAVLHAFTDNGATDTTFSEDGDLVLAAGEPDTVPGGLVVHHGRLYVSGYTRVGADTDAFLARVDADGGNFQVRRFDMRGRIVPATTQVVSRALDLAVVPGERETLVAAGSVDYTSDTGSTTTDWAAAAFTDVDGDLSQAGFGDLVLPAPGQGGLVSVAAGADGLLAVAGTHVDTTISDNSFGTARLLVDADKRCDLAVAVAEPAELVFEAGRPAPLTARVTNVGSRACGGVVDVGAPYRMTPAATGRIAPGATVTVAAAPVTYAGPRRTEDVLAVAVTSPDDANAANDRAAAHVVFSFCDVSLSPFRSAGLIPTEGVSRFEVLLRNGGTTACRVRVGSGEPYALAPGRSASDYVAVAAQKGARPGARVRVRLVASADEDVDLARNAATVSAMVVGVGDSRITAKGARGVSGKATKGAGRLEAADLRPSRVHVAVLRRGGKTCRWLASARGTFTSRKAGRGGACAPARWIAARGAASWRLRLSKALPRGSYVAYSRATIKAGFPEARFSARDGNRVPFRVR